MKRLRGAPLEDAKDVRTKKMSERAEARSKSTPSKPKPPAAQNAGKTSDKSVQTKKAEIYHKNNSKKESKSAVATKPVSLHDHRPTTAPTPGKVSRLTADTFSRQQKRVSVPNGGPSEAVRTISAPSITENDSEAENGSKQSDSISVLNQIEVAPAAARQELSQLTAQERCAYEAFLKHEVRKLANGVEPTADAVSMLRTIHPDHSFALSDNSAIVNKIDIAVDHNKIDAVIINKAEQFDEDEFSIEKIQHRSWQSELNEVNDDKNVVDESGVPTENGSSQDQSSYQEKSEENG